jgi:hypothetical protein
MAREGISRMKWPEWLRRSNGEDATRAAEWRRSWAAAIDVRDPGQVTELGRALDALEREADDAEDVEVEREMLDALEALVELDSEFATHGPPTIQTGHRAAGADRCHFAAPASLPDDPAQPVGTFLLTSARLLFVGGARAAAIPWHAVGRCERHDRDLLIVRADRQDLQRIRFNTFTDALRADFLVRRLSPSRRV